MEALQRENSRLRTQLVEVQSKLGRLLATVQSLTDSVSVTLDGTVYEPKDSGNESMVQDKPGSKQKRKSHEKQSQSVDFQMPPLDITDITESTETAVLSFRPSVTPDITDSKPLPVKNHPSVLHETETGFPGADLAMVDPGTLYQQIPNIWSFEYQMGLDPYIDAITASHHSSMVLGKEWIHSNSPFSDHIHVLQCLLKDKFSMMGISPELQGPTQR